jgi:hypothetical protein
MILAVGASALASATANPPKKYVFAKTKSFPASYDAVWKATISTFAEQNWPIMNLERDSGLITTDWMINNLPGISDCGARGKAATLVLFNVFVEAKGGATSVTVNADFKRGSAHCTSTGKLEKIIHQTIASKAAEREYDAAKARQKARQAHDPSGTVDGGDSREHEQ